MFKQIKEQLKEIAEIADGCPERYQERCFSILLEYYLSSVEETPTKKPSEVSSTADEKLPMGLSQDIAIHTFHIEKGKCEIIVKDLKVKKKADKQVRLALLLGIKHQIEEKMALIPRKELHQLCKDYAALDSSNFSANMKRHKDIFLIEKKDWKLTKPGENEAISVINELASEK